MIKNTFYSALKIDKTLTSVTNKVYFNVNTIFFLINRQKLMINDL